MELLGWNLLPDDSAVEFKFEEGPTWLKILALTPYLERFAYPAAVKRGLGILWSNSLGQGKKEALESTGWKIETREKTKEEKFFEGSLAFLTSTQGIPKASHCIYPMGSPENFEELRPQIEWNLLAV